MRAADWIVGFFFLAASPSLTKNFVVFFLKFLVIHGRYIMNNLGIHPGSLASNHAIAELYHSDIPGGLFPGLKKSDNG